MYVVGDDQSARNRLARFLRNDKEAEVMNGNAQDSESQTVQDTPKLKQTRLGLYVTAKEAYEKWEEDPEKMLLPE